MNGMQKKRLRREHAKRFTADGLPRDAREWTEADWRDLHDAMERVKENVRKRHQEGEDKCR
jgi:Trm5-related predicted tRNA methylase